MKDLLLAIKARLQGDTTLGYVRDHDIYITEDEMLIPATVRFPAIAIKDGDSLYQWETNRGYIRNDHVRITAYQSILKPEITIIGSANFTGLLDIIADIFTSLTNYRELILTANGGPAFDSVFPINEEASIMYGDEKEMIQRKTITFGYKRQKTIPR